MISRRKPFRSTDAVRGLVHDLMAERQARTARDTVADDCAEGFLAELEEALWLLEQNRQAEEFAFAHAMRKSDHVEDFRQILYRLHLILSDWEETA
jgi:hypothetical protein